MVRSDEGLTLETSAFESLYGGQFTLSTQLIEPIYLIFFTVFVNLKPINEIFTPLNVNSFVRGYVT